MAPEKITRREFLVNAGRLVAGAAAGTLLTGCPKDNEIPDGWWVAGYNDRGGIEPMALYINGAYWGIAKSVGIGRLSHGTEHPTVAEIFSYGLKLKPPRRPGLQLGTGFIMGPCYRANATEQRPLNFEVRITYGKNGYMAVSIRAVTMQFDIDYDARLYVDGSEIFCHVNQNYVCTQSFDTDATRLMFYESFKIAQMFGWWEDRDNNSLDEARYVDASGATIARSLADVVPPDYIFADPQRLSPVSRALVAYSDDQVYNQPSCTIHLDDPELAANCTPQGWMEISRSVPTIKDVLLWLHHNGVRTRWSAGDSETVSYSIRAY